MDQSKNSVEGISETTQTTKTRECFLRIPGRMSTKILSVRKKTRRWRKRPEPANTAKKNDPKKGDRPKKRVRPFTLTLYN